MTSDIPNQQRACNVTPWVERYTPITLADLPVMIGRPVHLAWASSAAFVWILDSIEGDTMFLHTPKTGKRITSNVKDAVYTRRYCPKHQEES